MPGAKSLQSNAATGLSKATGANKWTNATSPNTAAQTTVSTPTVVPSVAPTSAYKAEDLGTRIANLGSGINSSIDNLLSNYMDYANQGAAMANAESRAAQERQFAFNSSEAALQREYNTRMWEKEAQFNSAQAELTRAFNAAEAEKNRAYQTEEAKANRDWQERMANTAYQREIEDLKKAGLNPVLAALGSGAAVGSGGQGSGSQASASAASAGGTSGSSASGSNYTGQAHNMSETLAMLGAIGSMIGAGASAFGSWLSNKQSTIDIITEAGKGIFFQKRGKGTNTTHHSGYAYVGNNKR